MNRSKLWERVLAGIVSVMIVFAFMPLLGQDVYAATKAPAKVTIKSVAANTNHVTVKWGKAKNAKKYKVFVQTGADGWKYWKSVKANKTNKKKYSDKLKYKLKRSGKKYKIYKKKNPYKLVKITTARSYIYSGKYSTTYRFVLQAVSGKKAGAYSAAKSVKTGARPKPPADSSQPDSGSPETSTTVPAPGKVSSLVAEPKVVDGKNKIYVTWTAASNAASYDVYMKKGTGATATSYSFRQNRTDCKYTLSGATNGQVYTFKVIAKNKDGVAGDPVETSCTVPAESAVPEPGEVQNLKVVLTENNENARYKYSMTATWDAAADADSYVVVVTKDPDAEAKTYEYTATDCTFTFSTNSYSTKFLFTITPKNGTVTGKAAAVSYTTPEAPEEVIEISCISSSIYYYGSTDPGNANDLKSTVSYDSNSLAYNHASETVREGNSVYQLYYTPLVENNYFVIQPTIYTNNGVDHGVNCPVTWNVKENTFGAVTEVKGRNLVIKTPAYTSREQLRGKLIIELSSGEVKARELRFAPAFPEFIMGYDDLLNYDITPELRRALTLMDFEQHHADTNAQIEALVQSLTKNCTTDRQKVGAIIEWFHNNIAYVMIGDDGIGTVYGTWTEKSAVCSGMAHLLAQMFRYADIPAGIGEMRSLNHACSIFWLEGEWYATDGATYGKNFNYTNFSGVNYMCPITTGRSCNYSGTNITKSHFSSTGNPTNADRFINGTWVNNWELLY